eukprot:gene479-3811_t
MLPSQLRSATCSSDVPKKILCARESSKILCSEIDARECPGVRVGANVIYIWKRSACCCSYQWDHARSRPIAEAKPVWARLVLPWVT